MASSPLGSFQARENSSSSVTRESKTFDSSPRPANFGQSVIITRTTTTKTKTGHDRSTQNTPTRGSSGGGASILPIEAGQYVALTTSGVNSVNQTREREKKDMQDLNSRFADYLERVRFLEAKNRGLADELEKLKTKWGKETAQIKAMFQAELDETRGQLDDALKEKARLEIKSTSIEEELEFLGLEYAIYLELISSNEEKYRFQLEQISSYEREIEILRRNIPGLELEKQRNRELIAKLEAALAEARRNLDDETLGHIDAANRCQTIQEEIEFLKRVHDQEMSELGCLIYGGSEVESRDFWKKEMEQAIREIGQMYEDKMTTIKGEMETRCAARVNEAKERQKAEEEASSKTTEETAQTKNEMAELRDKLSQLMDDNTRLERELASLRNTKEARERDLDSRNMQMQTEAASVKQELDSLLRQLQLVLNTKATLELEIAAYRKLLEGEESRLDAKMNMNSESLSLLRSENSESASDDIYSSSSGELRAKTTFQTTAKGSLAISDCAPDGSRVTVENKGKKVESLVGWKISRLVDGKLEGEFVFDEKYQRIDPGKKINVYAHGKGPRTSGPTLNAELPTDTWGVGTRVITKLLNPEEEERATHNQQTVYTR